VKAKKHLQRKVNKMAQLIYNLSQADVVAALQAWVATKGHQMDATQPPVIDAGGGVTVTLNS
jgi:hypothetical protein